MNIEKRIEELNNLIVEDYEKVEALRGRIK